MDLIKNWRTWVFFGSVTLAFLSVIFLGMNFGIDFKGGTLFQVQFSEPITDPAVLQRITGVIEQRLNWTGLKDVSVYTLSNQILAAQTPETDPVELEKIESLLRKQGRFEVRIDGETVFDGAQVVNVDQSSGVPAYQSYGSLTGWNLPFALNIEAAKNFRDKTFHKCTMLSASATPNES